MGSLAATNHFEMGTLQFRHGSLAPWAQLELGTAGQWLRTKFLVHVRLHEYRYRDVIDQPPNKNCVELNRVPRTKSQAAIRVWCCMNEAQPFVFVELEAWAKLLVMPLRTFTGVVWLENFLALDLNELVQQTRAWRQRTRIRNFERMDDQALNFFLDVALPEFVDETLKLQEPKWTHRKKVIDPVIQLKLSGT